MVLIWLMVTGIFFKCQRKQPLKATGPLQMLMLSTYIFMFLIDDNNIMKSAFTIHYIFTIIRLGITCDF